VLAPGAIARKFAEALHTHTDQRIHAVGSRSLPRAVQFASEFGVGRAHGDYLSLVGDSGIDAVYIAAPHAEHRALAELAIAAGKHVLVEKPLATSAADARAIAEAAGAAGVFALEAMHTRFHPRTEVLLTLLADGALGEIRSVHADMGVHFPVDHTSRLYDPALGGGALLDLGVYAVWFAHLVLGVPENVVAWGLRTATGVDAQSVTVMRAGAAQGVVTTTLRSLTPTGASITGSAARIDWDARMPQPGGFTLVDTATREVLRFDDMTGIELQHGMCRQAAWMARNVADGLLQSPRHPLGTSVEVLDIIDSARRQLSDSPVVAD